MAFIYTNGGCGVRRNRCIGNNLYEHAALLGCPWLYYSISIVTDDEYGKVINDNTLDRHTADNLFATLAYKGYFFAIIDMMIGQSPELCDYLISLGDGVACYYNSVYWKNKNDDVKALFYARKGASQGVFECYDILSKRTDLDVTERTKYLINYLKSFPETSAINMFCSLSFNTYNELRQAMYLFGRQFAKGWLQECVMGDYVARQRQNANILYETTWSAAQQTVIALLFCCKKTGIYKDIAQIVAKLVWERREIPWLWEFGSVGKFRGCGNLLWTKIKN